MSTIHATHRSRLFATLCILFCASPLFSQSKTLSRTYEPIIVAAEKLAPLFMDSINVYTAYAYSAAEDSFFAIPFQIDEVTADGDFLAENDGVADSSDQVVFMPESAGDQAPLSKWVNETLNIKRIELAVTDAVTNQKAWVYLFANVSPKPAVTPLVTYTPGTRLDDTVSGKSYIEGHDADTGWFTYMSVIAPFGNGTDIVDRRKIRILLFLGISFPLTEDAVTFETLRYDAGPVRVLRELTGKLTFGSDTFTLPILTQYFAYSNVFSLRSVPIPDFSGVSIREIRQSLDLNQSAIGMSFYNLQNDGGLLINGVDDPKNDDLNAGLNWYLATGDPGTILVLMTVPPIGQSQKLFYEDDATNDDSDTGDKKSYGDAGWRLSSSSTITGSLDFDLTTFYFEKIVAGQTVATGEQFKSNALNPLNVEAAEQQRVPSAVSDHRGGPGSFVLDDAQPNPFWPLKGSVRLSFKLGQTVSAPSLRIFNLLGQEVARFDLKALQIAGNGNAQEVLWDGRGFNGQLLPVGVYFYQLQAGAQVATKKLIILR